MDTEEMDHEYVEEDHEDEEDSYQKGDDEYLDMGILSSGAAAAVAPLPSLAPVTDKISWKPEETNALLKKYKKHITQVKGFSDSSATFVTKIAMFGHIAAELSREFNCNITANQCQNRYKTMVRGRRRGYIKNMPTSDFEVVYTDTPANKNATRKNPPRSTTKSDDDESEFNLVQNALKVESNYDIEFSDSNNLLTNEDEDDDNNDHSSAKRPRIKQNNLLDDLNVPPPPPQPKQKTISGALLLRETMLEIYKMQEQNKDRRHQEWMDMWKSYLNAQQK